MTTTPTPKELWVLLKSNNPAVLNNPTQVPTKDCENVDHFLKAIRKELSPKLDQIAVDNITLHLTDADDALRPDLALNSVVSQPGFIINYDSPLFVKANLPIARSPTSSLSSCASSDEPRPKRLKLWDDLNTEFVVAGITKRDGSTPFSSITWSIVEDTFHPFFEIYQQDPLPIPDNKLILLFDWLSMIYKCFGIQLTGSKGNNEAKRVHLIAPIIWIVVSILDGVTVDVERTIRGRRLKANGKFEFMLQRQKKRICVVEAKKEDLDQGLAQDLVGCEVIADLDDSHEVYGIVTTFEKWVFLKNLDGKILIDEHNLLSFDGNGVPDRAQLEKVVGKIYHLLL